MKVKMYGIQELHCDSWSGNELGKFLYFRDELEAHQYRKDYNNVYNNKSSAPEYYMTFTNSDWSWVDEDKLVLTNDSIGTYCLESK